MSPHLRGRYPSDDEKFTVFPSRRSVVHGTKGVVSTASPLATQAGLRILREGGNAADAAIAAAAVLNLVDPSMTGLGGDCFCLFHDVRTKRVHAVNGSGRSAKNATLDNICKALSITDRTYGSIPPTSVHSVTVPGAAAAWVDIVEKYGSGLSLEQVLTPAIELAEEGFPISEISSYYWLKTEEKLMKSPNGTELLKKSSNIGDYKAPRAGEIFKNPSLAKTFKLLSTRGKAGFYDGSVAEAIIEVTSSLGGHLTLEDLKTHSSEETDAVPIRLRIGSQENGEIDLWEHPPNGQGIVAQMALGILQELVKQGQVPDFGPEEHNTTRYLHALIQCLRIAFADACWFITDPHASKVNPASLINSEYLTKRSKLFDPEKATTILEHGNPVHNTSDTIYLAVTDAEGNGCSLVNSVADTFGSLIVPSGTGFVLQNRGSGFNLDPDHPNAYAPSKRPYNTIIPAMITNAADDTLHTVFGVMGGAMQPQGHVQVLLNMLQFGMNPQVALDAPRICVGVSLPGKSTDPSKKVDNTVYLEEGITEQVARELEGMGHEIKYVKGMGRSLFGRGQIIRVHHDLDSGQRIYSAGSDLRGDGAAAPLV